MDLERLSQQTFRLRLAISYGPGLDKEEPQPDQVVRIVRRQSESLPVVRLRFSALVVLRFRIGQIADVVEIVGSEFDGGAVGNLRLRELRRTLRVGDSKAVVIPRFVWR